MCQLTLGILSAGLVMDCAVDVDHMPLCDDLEGSGLTGLRKLLRHSIAYSRSSGCVKKIFATP